MYSAMVTELLGCIKAQYGAEPEFLWASSPDSAAIRNARNRKWFAALMLDMPRKTLGLEGEGRVDIINLKCDPLMRGSVTDGRRILPGYHMNKEHWISVLLDGSVPMDEVCQLVDLSYAIIDKKR